MKRIAVVDGFSSGKFIAKELYECGCKLFHISSSPDLDNYYYNGFDYSIYDESIVHNDDERTKQFICDLDVDGIIAGAESGVLLADRLNKYFGFLYSNEYEKSIARRNKYEMSECLRHNNVRAVEQAVFSGWSEATEWINKQPFPIVLKPVDSAGSDCVYICNTVSDAYDSFFEIVNKKNKLNNINTKVLFQQFLDGVEYVVNFVFLNGRFLVTEVVRYHKKKLDTGNILYDIDELIDSTYPEFNILVEYTKRVCSVLGIKNGPCHAEVMLTDNGPCLVEIAARSDGIIRPDVSIQTTGMGQIMATTLSLINPKEFYSLTQQPYYKLKNHSFNVALINKKAGKFKSTVFVEKLKKLKSFHSVEFYIDENAKLEKTTSVFSQPGTVYLINSNKEQLLIDYHNIRELEASNIYNTID